MRTYLRFMPLVVLYLFIAVGANAAQNMEGDISKSPGEGILELTVKDAETQRPIKGVEVKIPDRSLFGKKIQTDPNGRGKIILAAGDYTIDEVKAQGYKIDFTERPFTIENDKTVSLDITLKRFPRLEGNIVYPDGSAAENIKVRLLDIFTKTKYWDIWWDNSGNSRTDREGHFALCIYATDSEIKSVSGNYPIFAFDSKRNLYFLDTISLGKPNAGLQLKPGLKVVGSLTDQNGSVVTGDKHISIVIGFKTGPNSHFSTGFDVMEGSDGQFEFGGIPTAPYELGLSFSAQGYKPFRGSIDPALARDGVIRLKPISISQADDVVVGIQGKVVFSNGNPVGGADISAVDFNMHYTSGRTDQQGCFKLTVPELPVKITASKTCEHWVNYSGKEVVLERDKDVTITILAPNNEKTFLPVVDPNQ